MRTAALALLLLAGCGASLRAQVAAVAAQTAVVADAGTATLLARYCAASMAAIGRLGALREDAARPSGVRCAASGPDAATPATDAQRADLAALRARWAPVLAAAEAVVQAQRAAAAAARAMASDATMLGALAALAGAYEALRAAATAAGVYVPPPLALAPSP